MKYKLEFDETERESFQECIDGWKYKAVINELFNFIRQQTKYEDKENISFDDLREKIVELLNEEELSL